MTISGYEDGLQQLEEAKLNSRHQSDNSVVIIADFVQL